MMRKLFNLFILLWIISCVDNNKNYVTINGETDRVGDAILLKIDPSGNQIDTTSIKKGNFFFKKQILEEELFRVKFHDGSSFDLLANVGENIKINFKDQKLAITGSPGSQKILELDAELLKLIEFRDSITKELQQFSKEKDYANKMLLYREKFFKKLDSHKLFLKKFIEENKQSKVSLIALFQSYGQSSPVLTIDEDLVDFEKVLENLKINFPESNHIVLLDDQIKQFKPLSYGQPAPDFTLPDLNKNPISLSDFKGKVLLVDFWASWCRPCRIENPKLVQLHNKYASQDFEILSISLDGTQRQKNPKEEWIKAIEKDNLSGWFHASELTGWETYVRELYNFNSIPHTVLIDKEGKIAAKNLRGTDLELQIKNLLQ